MELMEMEMEFREGNLWWTWWKFQEMEYEDELEMSDDWIRYNCDELVEEWMGILYPEVDEWWLYRLLV